jgi:hypothetical protein
VKDGIEFQSQLLPSYKIFSEICCTKPANGVGAIIELEMVRSAQIGKHSVSLQSTREAHTFMEQVVIAYLACFGRPCPEAEERHSSRPLTNDKQFAIQS